MSFSNLFQCFDCTHIKLFFLCLNRISYPSVCAYQLSSCHWGPQRNVWLHLLYCPHQQVFIYIDKQSQVSHSLLLCQIHQSFNHLCSPLFQSLHLFLALQNPRTGQQPYRWVPSMLSREERSFVLTCWQFLLIFSKAVVRHSGTVQAHVQIVAYQNSESFCTRLFSNWLASACTDA